jgi:hypothetical protein
MPQPHTVASKLPHPYSLAPRDCPKRPERGFGHYTEHKMDRKPLLGSPWKKNYSFALARLGEGAYNFAEGRKGINQKTSR